MENEKDFEFEFDEEKELINGFFIGKFTCNAGRGRYSYTKSEVSLRFTDKKGNEFEFAASINGLIRNTFTDKKFASDFNVAYEDKFGTYNMFIEIL